MIDKEGPSEFIIPEQRIYTCFTCKYYYHYMVQSGMRPIYDSSCKRLDQFGNILNDTDTFIGILYELPDDGVTPSCCPFIKSVKRDDKLNKIVI